jgi:BON domain
MATKQQGKDPIREKVRANKNIREQVRKELEFDPLVDPSGIRVKNINGDVALNGTVPSYRQYLDAAGDLAGHDSDRLGDAVTPRGTTDQEPVRRSDERVEVRAARLDEHEDKDGETERGYQRVDQQPQRAISGQVGSRDS